MANLFGWLVFLMAIDPKHNWLLTFLVFRIYSARAVGNLKVWSFYHFRTHVAVPISDSAYNLHWICIGVLVYRNSNGLIPASMVVAADRHGHDPASWRSTELTVLGWKLSLRQSKRSSHPMIPVSHVFRPDQIPAYCASRSGFRGS